MSAPARGRAPYPADSRPRVLQVITHLDLGGAEEVAITLAEQLHGHYDFHFFAVQGLKDTEVGQAMQRRLDRIGVPVFSGTRLELKRGGFLQAGGRLSALVRRLRPDLLHLHTEIPELTHALSRGFLNTPPGRSPLLVRTLHNTSFWGPWLRLGVQVERRLTGVPLAACSRAALDGMEQFHQAHGLPSLAPQQGRVIYNGVSPVRFSRDADRTGPLRIMFAGRLELQKGADLLPEILARAHAQGHPPAELNIYGAGSLGPALERWRAAGVPGWTVRILPPTPQLRAEMARHDLLLMPSRFEGLGLVAAEALMAGLPVIGTRIPGLGEVFPDGYPLLAPAEDAAALGTLLSSALKDPVQVAALARGWAAPTAEKFSVDRMASGYDELYQAQLHTHAPASQARRAPAP